MSVTALAAVTAGEIGKASWANNVREHLRGAASGIQLGYLNMARGYRATSTSYVLPDDYGRVRVDWDRVGSGWSVFALFEVITDDGSPATETVSVEIIDLADNSQEVEMASPAAVNDWTLQTALVIPQLTGIKYYTARIKGSDAAVGVGMVGGIYLAAP